jgi:uncharacterized membrane protein
MDGSESRRPRREVRGGRGRDRQGRGRRGIAAIVLGAVIATAAFAAGLRSRPFADTYRAYRQALGRAILLDLELLVAADIIRTVAIEPSFESLGVLAVIVLIRTFLSFTLELEVSGRWPWKQHPVGASPG